MPGLLPLDSPISARLARGLDEVAVIFERQLASEFSAVNGLCRHIEHFRGKMLRPTLVMLSGLAARGEDALPPSDGGSDADGIALDDEGGIGAITRRHLIVAAVVEMIHIATLVHDDVLDEAELRRRGRTVNRLAGNEAAVMLGDYLISNAFHLCSTAGDPDINLRLGHVTNILCEGELLQLHHRDDYGMSEATYFEIIERKTASLIGAACEMGGRLAGAEESLVQRLERAGRRLGAAFQIQDDLLDLLSSEAEVGKTVGRDLEKGKLTLPVIQYLQSADAQRRGRMLELIDARDAAAMRDELEAYGSIESSRAVAAQHVADARADLAELPPGPARDLFDQLAALMLERRA
jgi:octaprenyl-diphosphate synthase